MNLQIQPRTPARGHLFRDLISLWIFATSALCLGMLINQFRDQPLPLIYQNKRERLDAAVEKLSAADAAPAEPTAPTIQSAPIIRYVELAEFQSLANSGAAIVVDARPEIFHRLGHIPKALALPRDEFDVYYEKQRKALESFRAGQILIYCSGGQCEDSDLVAAGLKRLGFNNIAIFRGGWSEWTRNGLPEENS